MDKTKRKPNHLINEKSPYLLQHAYNPVDWHPWGEEAFIKARDEDKPVFLSIGYSTCHWCHVMEKESFEDDEVAEALNRDFIAIKVDREERPDIDHIYMTACQVLTGRGGWPLSILMTPDKKPFFAGTYFPKHNRMGVQGLMPLLEFMVKAWRGNRDALLRSGGKIIEALEKFESVQMKELKPDILHKAFSGFASDFDSIYGGFGNAPKFPSPQNIFFLLRYFHHTKDNKALEMVEKTLESMHHGGMYDHIGFGFSRYSTDRKWLAPHFEKMLYDNALLAIAYLETYLSTKKPYYAEIAQQIFSYVLRDMTSEEGAFYSAEDADSEGIEGKYYVWTVPEVLQVLGDAEGKRFCTLFDITDKGNFEGKNIPNLLKALELLASLDSAGLEKVKQSREKLLSEREKRVRPGKDDKILTSWNGLMIAAMAIGGRIINDPAYTMIAEKAAAFIFSKLIREDGRLLARYRQGESAYPGYLDDYAFLIWGLIELYETTYKPQYLQKALDLNGDLIKYFWDQENGGFFMYGSDGEQLITRPKAIYDGATPSGNSVAALNMLRLARLSGKHELEEMSYSLINAFGGSVHSYPQGHAHLLTALLFMEDGGKEVILVETEDDKEGALKMIKILNSDFRPFVTSLLYDSANKEILKVVPLINSYAPVESKTTAYICRKFACQSPVTVPDLFRQMLEDQN